MPERRPDVQKLFEEGTAIDRALKRGVREALLAHKRAGVPVVVWKDGKVAWVSADEALGSAKSRGSRRKKDRASRPGKSLRKTRRLHHRPFQAG